MAKKIIGMFLGLVLVTVLGVGAYAYTIYQQSTQTLAKTYKQIGEETKVIEATEPLTILLMGVDTGNVERTDPWAGNSDSMILVTVNPKTKKTVMMSLERDILTQIQQPDGSGDRGVGLYTVMKIVESYPNASLNTTCQDQVFRQVLAVHLLSTSD